MDPRVIHALEVMQRRLHEPLTVATLASEVDLSPDRFAHLFRAEVGVPPMRHLHELRLLRARHLLEYTAARVRDVMTRVGYNDPSHFAREFRRYHGISPRDLRTSARRERRARERGDRAGDEATADSPFRSGHDLPRS